jgi:hypothetical protein
MTQARSAHLSRARLAAVAAAVVIAAHGLAHLMGVALLWKPGEPGKLRYADVVPAAGSTAGYLAGALWLVAAALLVTAAALLATGRAWRLCALAGVLVSAPVIGLAPGQAVAGLVVDGLVLVLVAASWVRARAVAS